MAKGLIRIVAGLLLTLGAVGGMENPDQAEFFLEQIGLALLGLALMAWAARDINREADRTLDSLGKRPYN
jgi:heme O synthase-like polyprenyltransferase